MSFNRTWDGAPEDLARLPELAPPVEQPKPAEVRRITPPPPEPKPTPEGPTTTPTEPPPEEPEVVEPAPEVDEAGIPADAKGDYLAARELMGQADDTYSHWRDTQDTDKRNKTLKEAQALFEQARDKLRPWVEAYPNDDNLSHEISRALKGRYDCTKHRTK